MGLVQQTHWLFYDWKLKIISMLNMDLCSCIGKSLNSFPLLIGLPLHHMGNPHYLSTFFFLCIEKKRKPCTLAELLLHEGSRHYCRKARSPHKDFHIHWLPIRTIAMCLLALEARDRKSHFWEGNGGRVLLLLWIM